MARYVHFDGMFARIAAIGADSVREIVTTAIRPGGLILVDRGRGETGHLTETLTGHGSALVAASRIDRIGPQLAQEIGAVYVDDERAFDALLDRSRKDAHRTWLASLTADERAYFAAAGR